MTRTADPTLVLEPPAHAGASRRALPVGFLAVHGTAWLLAAVAVLLRDTGMLATIVALAYLTFFPGDALRAACRVRAGEVHLRALLGVAGSVVLLLAVSLASSLALGGGTALGVAGLSATPLFVGVTLAVGAALGVVAVRRDHEPGAVPTLTHWLGWGLLMLATHLTWIGAAVIDAGKGPWVSVAALAALSASAVWATVSRSALARALRPAVLLFLTLGVAWSFSQHTGNLYGFDVHQEMLWSRKTLAAGAWHRVLGDPYAAMLSVTTLPASLCSLTGLGLLAYFKVYAPLFLALYVMGAFLFARRYVGDRTAFLVTVLFMLVPASLWQLPAVSRQEVALMLFSATVLLLFGAGGAGHGVRAFTAAVAAGTAVTHYTSSYVAVMLLAGGLLLSLLVRGLAADRRSLPRRLSVVVVTALTVAAVGWNAVVTKSSVNVGNATSASSGLRQESNPLQTFLSGATIAQVPPAEYFAETKSDATAREWLVPYPIPIQDTLESQARPVRLPEQYGPAAALAPLTEPLYVLVRQAGNALMVLGVLYLALRLYRRRRGLATDGELDLVAVAAAALALNLLTRFNASLSQTYNPERLALQTAFVLAVAAGALIEAAGRGLAREPEGRHARRALARPARLAAPLLAGVLTALLVLDATGLHAAAVVKDSGNLQPDGEYARRYALTDGDTAAATWLGRRYRRGDMVFADTYGALALQSEPAFSQGLFAEISPYTLDQRAYVYATAENAEGGRARLTKRGVRTAMKFPAPFIRTYKSRYYTNGSAEVYR